MRFDRVLEVSGFDDFEEFSVGGFDEDGSAGGVIDDEGWDFSGAAVERFHKIFGA